MNIVSTLNYLSFEKELEIVLQNKNFNNKMVRVAIKYGKVADLSRKGFINGDISTVMSPRTVYIGLKTLIFLKIKDTYLELLS